jgi:drug/metabolite transporter (DMT)-like permease
MLKKGLTPLKIAVLVISFAGVVIMLTGKTETSILVMYDPDPDIGSNDENNDTFDFQYVREITVSLAIPMILMLCVPILNAIITILFAKMKGLSELTVCSY